MTRSLHELIVPEQDAWPLVLEWVASATSRAELLPVEPGDGEAALLALQVTNRSPMGALALHSGGVLIDRGWLRVLGAGHPRLGDGLREWNGLDGYEPPDPALPDALLVAYDAVGGFFVVNGGGLTAKPGELVYFAPDTYDQDPTGMGYSDFLQFALSGDLDAFYGALRWPGWQDEVAALGPGEVMTFYPFLGFEDTPLQDRVRRGVAAREAWHAFHTIGPQLRDVPPGGQIEVTFT